MGVCFVVIVLLLSETQRKLVGNGSIPTRGTHRCLFDKLTKDRQVQGDEDNGHRVKWKHHFSNPFKCIPMLFCRSNFAVILTGSITYAFKMVLQSSLSAQCIEVYDLNYLQAGLIYLPSGVGGAIASYITGLYHLNRAQDNRVLTNCRAGRFLDKNINMSSKMGRDGQYRGGDDISDFPIEETRLSGGYTPIVLTAASTAGYRISLMERAVRRSTTSPGACIPAMIT